MIKIKIEHIQPPANCHYIEFNKFSIHFGSDNVYKFKNISAAQLFLNKLNNYLNDTIFRLNHVYTEIYLEYRLAWFYVESKNNFTQIIVDVENKFNKLYKKVTPDNYPYFLFNDLLYLIDLLKHFAEDIREINREKKIYNAYGRLNMLINMLDEISKRLQKLEL